MNIYDEVKFAIGELDEDIIIEKIEDFINSNPEVNDVDKMINACQEGMGLVGDKFEAEEYFVGDLIFAGDLLQETIEKLKPLIGGDSSKSEIGVMVLGSAPGDLHDIGKNIFKSMAEASGFKVYDLGVDVPVNVFADKVEEVKPDIVGISGLLTMVFPAMKEVVDELKRRGLRGDLKVMIGGNPVTAEVAKQVGADIHSTNAAEGLKVCKSWVGAN